MTYPSLRSNCERPARGTQQRVWHSIRLSTHLAPIIRKHAQYARFISTWVAIVGLDASLCGTFVALHEGDADLPQDRQSQSSAALTFESGCRTMMLYGLGPQAHRLYLMRRFQASRRRRVSCHKGSASRRRAKFSFRRVALAHRPSRGEGRLGKGSAGGTAAGPSPEFTEPVSTIIVGEGALSSSA